MPREKLPDYLFVSFTLIPLLLLAITGCSRLNEPEVRNSDSVELRRSFGFVFPKGDHIFLVPNDIETVKQVIREDAAWKVSRGLVLEKEQIRVLPGKVKWPNDVGDGEASAEGVVIALAAKVQVESVAAGEIAQVEVDLPGLVNLETLAGTKPELKSIGEPQTDDPTVFESDVETNEAVVPPNTYVAGKVHVHGSILTKYISKGLKGFIALMGLCLVMIVGGACVVRGEGNGIVSNAWLAGPHLKMTPWNRAGWPIQACCWLEWAPSTSWLSLPAARSRLFAVHSDSISTHPSSPVA